MTKSERTRALIVEKTAPLFNQKGFDGTSLNDLTEATGLTKGALYGHFEDKEEIAREAFTFAVQKVKDMVAKEMLQRTSCKGQLFALLDFFARYVNRPPIPGGCPLLNTAIEADDHRTSMRKHVAREIFSFVRFIETLLVKGMQAGEFNHDTNAKELAYTFFCSIEGALMYARVERSSEPMDIIVKHCKKIIEQISKIK